MDVNHAAPDCATCWKRETCENALEGWFCPQWQSREPKPGPDPSDAWRRGEETDFDSP